MSDTERGASVGRRRLLRSAAGGAAGLSLVSATEAAGQEAAEAEATVTFEDQTTDGREVVIAELTASVDVTYTVATDGHETTYARRELSADETLRDRAVALDRPVTEDRLLEVSVYPADGGGALATDEAEVTLTGDVEYADELPVTSVDADPDAGFEHPYFLYAPPVPEAEAGGPVLVEPNNTGTSTDDFDEHADAAERRMKGGTARRVADRLGAPLLMPVFPRPRSEPVDWRHYTHQLDRRTLQIYDGPLERIDRQLLRMVDDARERLAAEWGSVDERILLNGFSASGNFVDRFAVLHPDRVLSVTAGGLNGMTLLPLSEAKGHTLNYHVGIADVEELTGEAVDLDELDAVNQFFYMGSEDDSDTIPYEDAWSDEDLRRTALEVYGEEMIEERFPFCQSAYEDAGVSAQFRVYEGAGHTPRPAEDDVVEFHRRSVEGESVEEFGQRLGLDARMEYAPTQPAVGETVAFDASASRVDRGEIVAFTWAFGDGETAAGESVAHEFESPGTHAVELTAIDEHGRTDEVAADVVVGDDGTGTRSGTDSEANARTDAADGAGGERRSNAEGTNPIGISAPGFGASTALAALAGATYALRRLLEE